MLSIHIKLYIQKEQLTLLDEEGHPSLFAPIMIVTFSTCAQLERDNISFRLLSGGKRYIEKGGKRNMERFPERFRFQLTKEEMAELVTNCDRFNSLKHSTVRSYAFTEQGVAMLSTVLRSETAIRVSIRIMDAFVAMRRFLVTNAEVFQRLSTMESTYFL